MTQLYYLRVYNEFMYTVTNETPLTTKQTFLHYETHSQLYIHKLKLTLPLTLTLCHQEYKQSSQCSNRVSFCMRHVILLLISWIPDRQTQTGGTALDFFFSLPLLFANVLLLFILFCKVIVFVFSFLS
jgi:hypothetical protein